MKITNEQAEYIKAKVNEVLPNVPVLVLAEGMSLTVLHPTEPD